MRITDLLKSTAIELNANVSSKSEAIDKLVALHQAAGNLTDSEKFKEDILKREEHSTTAIGEGIAVPHAKSSAVKTPHFHSSPFLPVWITMHPTVRKPTFCL